MATVTQRNFTTSTAQASSYASTSFTPGANELLVVMVVASDTAGASPTMTDSAGLGFTLVGSRAAYRTSLDSIYWFIANTITGGSPASMTVTFDCTGDAGTGCIHFVAGVTGMSRTGANALKQFAKVENQAASGTPAPAFGASADTNNPTLGLVGNSTSPAGLTPPTNWTESANGDKGYSNPITGGEWAFRNSGFTGTTITWGSTSASAFAASIVELDTSAGDATVTPATIARAFTMPAASPSAGAAVSPSPIARAFGMDGAGPSAGSTATPGVIARSFVMDGVTVLTGGGSATVTPAVIARAITMAQASPSAGATVSPATIARLLAMAQASPSAGVVITPATIARSVVMPQVVAGGSTTVAPATIARAVIIPQAAFTSGAIVTPGAIIPVLVIPQATAVGNVVAAVLVIDREGPKIGEPGGVGILVLDTEGADPGQPPGSSTLVVEAEGPDTGAAPGGSTLTVEAEGPDAGAAPAGPVRVVDRG